MGSVNAKNVALDVLESVRKGKKVNLGKIIKENGYADTTSTVPSQVTNTKTYQKTIQPIVELLEKERQEIMKRLPKVRSKAKYRDLIDGMDKATKNIQLLNGGKTSNDSVKISWE